MLCAAGTRGGQGEACFQRQAADAGRRHSGFPGQGHVREAAIYTTELAGERRQPRSGEIACDREAEKGDARGRLLGDGRVLGRKTGRGGPSRLHAGRVWIGERSGGLAAARRWGAQIARIRTVAGRGRRGAGGGRQTDSGAVGFPGQRWARMMPGGRGRRGWQMRGRRGHRRETERRRAAVGSLARRPGRQTGRERARPIVQIPISAHGTPRTRLALFALPSVIDLT